MQAFRQLGPYELVDRLAVGGMAEIYLARASGVQGFNKEYVLKLIHPKYVGDHEFIQMLVDEAKLVAALTHPNVAQVIDLGLDGESYYILMEYVRGKDLYQVLNTAWDLGFNLPIPMCLSVARDICSGLYYAHHKRSPETGRPLNIVHRDISPQNVIVSYNGEAKILDFGVAKAALGARPETRAGIIKGKFRYMSPEQAWGEQLDGRSDLFSVGLCLYEMICGETAYDDDGDMQKMLLRMRDAQFVPPSRHRAEVDPELEAIIMKALARNRDDRYPTCHAFEVALTTYLHRHYPGFTRMDVTTVMQEMYAEEMAFMHVPEASERSVTDSGAAEISLADIEELGFIDVEPDDDGFYDGTDDMTLRHSILRGPSAEPSYGQPVDFFHQEEEPTRLDLDRDDLLSDETVSMPSLQPSIQHPSRPMHGTPSEVSTMGFKPQSPPSRDLPQQPRDPHHHSRDLPHPPHQSHLSQQHPQHPQHSQRQRVSSARRPDTVARMIQRYLPPAAATPAMKVHDKVAVMLESDRGANIIIVVIGVSLAVLVLLLYVVLA